MPCFCEARKHFSIQPTLICCVSLRKMRLVISKVCLTPELQYSRSASLCDSLEKIGRVSSAFRAICGWCTVLATTLLGSRFIQNARYFESECLQTSPRTYYRRLKSLKSVNQSPSTTRKESTSEIHRFGSPRANVVLVSALEIAPFTMVCLHAC